MIEALAGMSPRKRIFLHAKSKSEIKTKTGLKRFLPAILSGEFEHAEVELAAWQGSGDIAATARANCYVVIPPDHEADCCGGLGSGDDEVGSHTGRCFHLPGGGRPDVST